MARIEEGIIFYHGLVSNESVMRELGDEILKKVAVEITGKLRQSATVDCQVRKRSGQAVYFGTVGLAAVQVPAG